MQDGRKAVWSIPYVSVASFFPSLKQNSIAYRSSKMSSRPHCIFENHQLWQSGFSRVYSNEQLQQQLEYTLQKPDCHRRWISKMQSGREDTLEERYAIKFCFKLGKNAAETYGMLETSFGASCMNRASVFEWHKRFMQDGQKAVWSIPYVSVAFSPSLKQNFIAYLSSKVSSRPDYDFEIPQLWQSGFSRVYSDSCCSCWFEPEIIKIS